MKDGKFVAWWRNDKEKMLPWAWDKQKSETKKKPSPHKDFIALLVWWLCINVYHQESIIVIPVIVESYFGKIVLNLSLLQLVSFALHSMPEHWSNAVSDIINTLQSARNSSQVKCWYNENLLVCMVQIKCSCTPLVALPDWLTHPGCNCTLSNIG